MLHELPLTFLHLHYHRVDDLSDQAKGALDRAKRSSGSSSSSTSRGTSAYGASELDSNVKSAIQDLDRMADDVRK